RAPRRAAWQRSTPRNIWKAWSNRAAYPAMHSGTKNRAGKQHARTAQRLDTDFGALLSDVTPLPQANRAIMERPRPLPIPEQRLRDDQETLKESLGDWIPWEQGIESGEELVYARTGVSPQMLRRLRRGHWSIQAVLDLHGLTVVEARPAVVEFLSTCRRDGLRCLRIIHGKGLRSRNREPVLKRKLAHWLMQRDEILAFCQARQTEGGGGAVVVLLKA
ncbi:MAG TPA: Smr/MutS family protein, partial [Burkholderiales bacterium]|nr:Smr/MutS family protein [Burkholderiales bacterium]